MKANLSARSFSVILVLALSLLTGCAGLSHKKEDPATVVRNRATAFLQAMTDKDWAAAYEFFESTFKDAVSPELFAVFPRDTEYTGFSVLDVTVSETGKTASVNVTLDIRMSPQGFTFDGIKKVQNWILQKGEWVLVEPPPSVNAPQ